MKKDYWWIPLLIIVASLASLIIYELGQSFSKLSVGNIGSIVNVESTLPLDSVEIYIDTLLKNYPEYQMPSDWASSYYGHSDHLTFKFIYFQSPPEEAYFITLDGFFSIRYTMRMVDGIKVIGNQQSTPSSEKLRIENRIRTEILPKLKTLIDS